MVEVNKSADEFEESTSGEVANGSDLQDWDKAKDSVEAASDSLNQDSPKGSDSEGSSYAETGSKTETEVESKTKTSREDTSIHESGTEQGIESGTGQGIESGTEQGIDVTPDHIVQDSEIPSYAGGDRNSSEGATSSEEGSVESKAHTESEPETKSNSGSSDSDSAYRDTHSRGYEA